MKVQQLQLVVSFDSPSFSNPNNIIFAHVRHVKVVHPCGLGKREKTIKFCTKIAYLSQRLLVSEDFLKEILDDFQLPICIGVSDVTPVPRMATGCDYQRWKCGGPRYAYPDLKQVNIMAGP